MNPLVDYLLFLICQAYENIAALEPPSCPEGVNPMLYTSLLFGRNCQVCPIYQVFVQKHDIQNHTLGLRFYPRENSSLGISS